MKGYKPDVVLDLGAYKGEWTYNMQQRVFKDSVYHLFEPNKHQELANVCNVHNVLLNDCPGDSIFKEKTFHFDNCNIEKRLTIDLDTYTRSTVRGRKFPSSGGRPKF